MRMAEQKIKVTSRTHILSSKQVDFLVVVFLLLVGSFIAYRINARNVLHGVLFLGIPSLYLFLRKKKNYSDIFWGVLLFGVLFGILFDILMVLNGAWQVPRPTFSLILFDTWVVDTIIGYVFMVLFTLVFYEHFLENKYHPRLSPRHSKIFFVLVLIDALVMIIAATSPDLLKFSYAYFWGGIAGVVFPLIFGFFNPKIISKFASLSLFFFFVWFLLENVGMRLNGWVFSGTEYIGTVTLSGITFPIEEVLFWMIWYPAAIVAYYEYFVDDGR